MSERRGRVVAELGRPETAEETAARKAKASKAYRSSQTVRNLVIALGVTLALVLVMVWSVPRGEPAGREAIDVEGIAASASDSYGRDLLVLPLPTQRCADDADDDWCVNVAQVDADRTNATWTVVYAKGSSYLRVSQAFDADSGWAAELLGTRPDGTVTIDGVDWERYRIADPAAHGNVSYALGTQAGSDHVLVYGTASAKLAEQVAGLATPELSRIGAKEAAE